MHQIKTKNALLSQSEIDPVNEWESPHIFLVTSLLITR